MTVQIVVSSGFSADIDSSGESSVDDDTLKDDKVVGGEGDVISK